MNEIKLQKDNSLIAYAFQFALIEYSKPYRKSSGTILNTNGKPKYKYKLGTEFVPEKYLALHERILTARDQFHAHLDLSVRDPKIYEYDTESGRSYSVAQNIIYGTEEISKIDNIIDLIENTLDNMRVEFKRSEAELPTSPQNPNNSQAAKQ